MKAILFFFAAFFLLQSCGSNASDIVELQQFSKIKVNEFKKKNVHISTALRFYNSDDKNLSIEYAEFDIYVNGKDVGTFIQKKSVTVPANGLFELPINVDFPPEDAFLNLDYGLLKIKSDIVSDVRLYGYLKSLQNGKEVSHKYDVTQKVLFTNNGKLYLDEDGKLKEK